MLEDNTVSKLLDGHGDLQQSEGTPALNDGVYDHRCLCKSPLYTSSSYHDHRRRPAPPTHGHLSSLQLTLTSSADTRTILSCPVFSSRDSKSRRSGIISKLLHNQPVQLLHREEPLRCVKLSPLSTLHGSWWHQGVSLLGLPCRATCIPRCVPWSAVGTERNGDHSPCRGTQVTTRGESSRGFTLSSSCALLAHHGKVWGLPAN